METNELALRMEADCKILGNAHRNRFSKYRNLHINLGLPSALLATAAGSFATISANAEGQPAEFSWLEIVGLFCTWTVALLTAATTFLRPHETSQGHRERAGSYDVLLGQIGRALTFAKGDDLKKQLEEIDKKIEDLKLSEPFLSDKRIRESKAALIRSGDLPNQQMQPTQ